MNNHVNSLDLSGLDQFRASDLLDNVGTKSSDGTPLQVAVSLIDFDPSQPRRTLDEATMQELAQSIATHGILEPVSLRTHPDQPGRFIVNRGERRVRAAMRSGLASVPAFIDEHVDPYAQAAENLHRDAMSPFDLANFIAEREKEGQSRAEIARKLNKPRSFITEVACLVDAAPALRDAFDKGRVNADRRLLYQLMIAMRSKPVETEALLTGPGVVTRANLEALLDQQSGAAGHEVRSKPSVPVTGSPASAGRTVLVVEHGGRRGSLRLKANDKDLAEVRYGDGSRDMVRLPDLRLVCWATEE